MRSKRKRSSLTGHLLGGRPKEIEGGNFQVEPQAMHEISKLAKFALRLLIGEGFVRAQEAVSE